MSDYPYPGLRPFLREESDIFFGRETQTDDLLEKLQNSHFLAVLGPSGCGKSSLVRAGLLAGIDSGFMGKVGANWAIAEMRPGDKPYARLADSLLDEPVFAEAWQVEAKTADATAFLQAALQRGPLSLEKLLANSRWPKNTRLLILVDQFEEIFRYHQVDENQASAFIALLLAASRHADIYIVITMRSDFLGNTAAFEGLPEAINQGIYLTPRLSRAQLEEAIAIPARLFGGEIEDSLVNHLLNEAGNDPDQLPLLQHALMRLWQNLDQDRLITLTQFQLAKGLKGSLDEHADQAYSELNEKQQEIAETLFRALTERGSDGREIRRPFKLVEIGELAGVNWQTVATVIKPFRHAGRNFLTVSGEPLNEDSVIDISHESLIRQWQRLRHWVEQEAEKAAIYRRLEQAALRNSQGVGEIWRGIDLDIAIEWFEKETPSPEWACRYGEHFDTAIKFLHDSREQCAKEQQSLAQRLFDSKLTHASLLAKTEDFAAARKLLQQSRQLDQQVPATRRHARNMLAAYVDIMGGEAEQTYQGAGAALQAVAVSPGGRWLAAAGENGTQVLFERESGRLLHRLEGHDGNKNLRDIVFDPEGGWLYSAGDDRQIIRWSLQEEDKAAKTDQQWQRECEIQALAISPDCSTLAAGRDDGIIELLQADNGTLIRRLKGHTGAIAEGGGLAFSPDGRMLASASYDHTVNLWDWRNGKTLHQFHKHSGEVLSVAFSPDGKILASSSKDQTIILWDAHSGKEIRRLGGHQNIVFGLHFFARPVQPELTETNWLLSSASFDKTLRLWDVDSGLTLRVLQGHVAGVLGLAIWQKENQAPQLFSASNDGTVKRWPVGLSRQWLIDMPEEPLSVAISPDGNFLAVGFASGGIRTYHLPLGQLLNIQRVHQAQIYNLNFNFDGTLLASASFDKTVKVWTVETDGKITLLKTLGSHDGSVYRVSFSTDGRVVASAAYDGRIGLFNLDSNETQFIDAHQGQVASAQFDTEGKRLLTAGVDDKTVKLWNLETQPPTLLESFPQAPDKIIWSSLSPDGRWMACVGRGSSVYLYKLNAQDQTPLHLIGHEDVVYKAIFSQDSCHLLTVSRDATVRLWDLETQNELFSLRLPTHAGWPTPLWDFDFRCTPSGCWLAVPLTRGKLALYNFGKAFQD